MTETMPSRPIMTTAPLAPIRPTGWSGAGNAVGAPLGAALATAWALEATVGSGKIRFDGCVAPDGTAVVTAGPGGVAHAASSTATATTVVTIRARGAGADGRSGSIG
jgi:hypothetical protein